MLFSYWQDLDNPNRALLYRVLEDFQPVNFGRLNTAVSAGYIDVASSGIPPEFVFPPDSVPIKSITYFPAETGVPAQFITIRVGTATPAQALVARDWFDIWNGLEDIRIGPHAQQVYYAEADLELWQENPRLRLVLGSVRVAPGHPEIVGSNLASFFQKSRRPQLY